MDAAIGEEDAVANLQMPGCCVVRLPSRRKPMFLEFTNPLSVLALGALVGDMRSMTKHVGVTVTELLSGTGQACWRPSWRARDVLVPQVAHGRDVVEVVVRGQYVRVVRDGAPGDEDVE
ncbi:hypothetical protein [Kribbella sp. NPDC050459]|uniref:hypothetical protein n=1 Tax=Kribbella sp. NPDC050459 TaxID=3155785 RepID=UPI0033C9D9A7